MSSKLPYIAALITVTLWASAFPAVRYVLRHLSPEALMLYRFIIASTFLLSYCFIKKIPPPKFEDAPLFILSGFVGLFLYMWAFNAGTVHVQAGISSFIISSAPIITLVLSIFMINEKATPLIWVGAVTSFVGIGIIGLTNEGDFRLSFGILLLVGAAFFTSFYNIFQKQILEKYSPIQATTYSIAFGSAPMFIFMPNMVRELPSLHLGAHFIVAYLAIFPAAIAYFLWIYALSKAEKVIYVTSFSYLSPFLATIFAFLWLGETIPAMAILGGVVVIIGMIIAGMRKKGMADKGAADR